ncbi:1-acyl-sn-glycerol-3-phosphate acyltransferase [Nocardioides sp. B-3]|nr:1-acyl-sn-glycerol-3-phosphate acyltransferase [Nocardioides sp. B-3]UUZ61080.1 1-acyl-sn-glycerol-3-phosphate acyltransferase [Nocardioides sp. B-3]
MTRALRRLLIAPAVVLLTAALWVSLPLWLIVAAAMAPIVPGRWRALRLLWVLILYLTAESLLLLVLLGLWLASGFGWRIRSPYFAGIHYDLGAVGAGRLLPRGPARAGAEDPHRRPGAGGAPDSTDPGVLPARGAGRLVHADVCAAALVQPRAARRAQGHLGVGPGDRRAAQPDPGVLHLAEPRTGRGVRDQDRPTGLRARRERRVRDLPGGRHFTPERRDRAIARLRKLGLEKMAERAERMTNVLAPRPGGFLGGPRRRARGRRRAGRAHRARPHAHRRRRLARAADGQGAHHALVGGAARRHPRRSRRADRLALRLVGAHRRVDRPPQAEGAAQVLTVGKSPDR